MLLKVRILNNSSRAVEALVLYSDLLEVRYVRRLFKPYEVQTVEIPIRLRVLNLTIPYVGENRSAVITPDFFEVCTYPMMYRAVRARCVAYIDAYGSTYIRSLAIREVFVLRNATLLTIDVVLENRCPRPSAHPLRSSPWLTGAARQSGQPT